MSSAYLSSYINNANFALRRGIPALENCGLDWDGIQRLCVSFRQRGVCSLLHQGVAEPFHRNMMQSGGAFLHYLSYAPDAQKATSQAKPFLDAIGSCYWDCARAIAQQSRQTWNEDEEYEEDFLYARFLMECFFLGADQATLEQRIARQDEVLKEGGSTIRLEICKSFFERDNKHFEETLVELLDERAATVEDMIAKDELPEEAWSWLRYFSSEGLALVRLAERIGFKTKPVYLHIPAIVRTAPNITFDPDAWRLLPPPETD